MPGTIDLVIGGLIALAYPIWDYLSWQRMVKTIASGRPNARVAVYREVIATLWILAAVVASAWIHAARPWHLIGLSLPTGWCIVATVAVMVALWAFFQAQVRVIRRLNPAQRERVRVRAAGVSPLIARNRLERAWFMIVSVSAGVCEEFIYRGFLIWAFRPWLGLWGAALASTVSFALAHSYQGRAGAIRAGVTGAIFAVIAIAMGSIVPVIVLHALLDLLSGEASYALFGEDLGPAQPLAS